MSKGEETRTAILDEAVQVASRVGLTSLSIGQLAEQTGMSKSGLFAHFRSKEQLQLDTLDHARRAFIDTVARPALATPRGEARLRALFDRWLVWEVEGLEGGCPFTSSSLEFDDRPPGPVRDYLVRNQRDMAELIATVAGTAIDEGDFRADVDPELIAFRVNGIILAYHLAARLVRDPRARDQAVAAFEALLTEARPT